MNFSLVLILFLTFFLIPVFAQESTLNEVSNQLENQITQDNLKELENRVLDLENSNITKETDDENTPFDIPNWLTLLLEISIAVPFAIYLFLKQQKISKQLENVIFREAQFRKYRHDFGIISIHSNLEGLKNSIIDLKSEIESYQENEDPEENTEPLKKIWDNAHPIMSYYFDSLKNMVIMLGDVLDNIESERVLEIHRKISNPILVPVKELQVDYLQSIIGRIDAIIKYLNENEPLKSLNDSK